METSHIAADREDVSQRSTAFWWAMGSAVAMVLGAFGPWVKVFGFISVSGTDGGDGWIVVFAAALAAGLLFLRERRGLGLWPIVVALIAALAAAATAIYDLSNLAAWGIYLAMIGSLSLAVACVVLAIRTRSRQRPMPDASKLASDLP